MSGGLMGNTVIVTVNFNGGEKRDEITEPVWDFFSFSLSLLPSMLASEFYLSRLWNCANKTG